MQDEGMEKLKKSLLK